MKNLILSIALLLCSILLLPNTANAICPNLPPPDPGWNIPGAGTYTDILIDNGCVIQYTYCYRVNPFTGFHEIALVDIKLLDGCDPAYFEANKGDITDKILIHIAQGEVVQEYWELGEIPECPNDICLLRIYDKICYSGWDEIEEFGRTRYEMILCNNDYLRKCSETIRICWEGNPQNIVVQRYGFHEGPPCRDQNHLDCILDNCGY